LLGRRADGSPLSSRRPFGAPVRRSTGDYLAIHEWFDESKAHIADVRHRALRHHSEGIFLCEAVFGTTLKNSVGKIVPVRTIGEQHVNDDLGWIPSVKDWLQHLQLQPWMGRTPFRPQLDGNEDAEFPTAESSSVETP
jgi:uncharacterized protein DUF6915